MPSYCPICGLPKSNITTEYNVVQHYNLMLLRFSDRHYVCDDCHKKCVDGELLVLHTQLPLPRVCHGYPKGVFTTKKYRVDAIICEYNGEKMTDLYKVHTSKSQFIIQSFVGDVSYDKQSFIEGKDCTAIYINHFVKDVWDANVEFVMDEEKEKIFGVALKDVPSGSELFVDYGTDYWKDKKPMTKSVVNQIFRKTILEDEKLKTNLRYSSSQTLAVSKWVRALKHLMRIRQDTKNEKQKKRDQENKKKRVEGELVEGVKRTQKKLKTGSNK